MGYAAFADLLRELMREILIILDTKNIPFNILSPLAGHPL